MSERSGGREQNKQSGASKQVSVERERANGRASGPVLQSVFLAVLAHSDSADSADSASLKPFTFPFTSVPLSVEALINFNSILSIGFFPV